MSYQLRTKQGYDFFEVASSLQKAIRRNDPKVAGYFGLELLESGYYNYVWKRLLTVSAEDCGGIITQEIFALYESFKFINDKKKAGKIKGRIFLSKAIILLCEQPKNRDADHLQNLVYDKKRSISEPEIKAYLMEITEMDKQEIPEYAYDVHTKKGKLMGMTKEDFFKDEFEALNPRQPGLFDNLI